MYKNVPYNDGIMPPGITIKGNGKLFSHFLLFSFPFYYF